MTDDRYTVQINSGGVWRAIAGAPDISTAATLAASNARSTGDETRVIGPSGQVVYDSTRKANKHDIL